MIRRSILLIEDEQSISEPLSAALRREGFEVVVAPTARTGMEAFRTRSPDLVLLDIMLPDGDGREILREIRARSRTPVVMLTARGEEMDRVLGLELGADDYLPKPFGRRELLARIRAVLRRSRAPVSGADEAVARTAPPRLFCFEGWMVDLARRELVSPAGAVVDLSGAEYDLLIAFLEHPQRVLARNRILELARGRLADPFDRSVDVLVSRLRRKIESEGGTAMIKTVRGAGYIFLPAVERAA